MRLVKLNRPSSLPVYVNPDSVAYLELCGPESTCLYLRFANQFGIIQVYVAGSPEQIVEALEGGCPE